MSDMNTIQVKDLIVEHATASGPLRILNCPELTIAGGTTTAITGRSGSGKSTLLGLLAGLGMPTKGSVTIGSTNLTGLPEPERVAFRRDAIGLVYQADNLLPFLTVAENVHLQLALCADTDDAEERIDDLLDRLGLGDLWDRLPDQLSGGQRQRVAVARAIVHRPAVILADEPTGSLDEENADTVIELLLDAQQLLGSTLVLVTHNLPLARAMARMVELREGSIVVDQQVS
jgi:putative ABC transport system ATP-binding protein